MFVGNNRIEEKCIGNLCIIVGNLFEDWEIIAKIHHRLKGTVKTEHGWFACLAWKGVIGRGFKKTKERTVGIVNQIYS